MQLAKLMDSTGLTRPTTYKLIGAKEFRRPAPLVGWSVEWVESEVHDWIKDRIALRDFSCSRKSKFQV